MSAASTVALLIASAQAPLGSTLIAVALPSIGIGTGADLVLITGLLVTGYLVVNVVFQGPAGKISDLVGHSRILWAGILLYVIGAAFGLLVAAHLEGEGGVELNGLIDGLLNHLWHDADSGHAARAAAVEASMAAPTWASSSGSSSSSSATTFLMAPALISNFSSNFNAVAPSIELKVLFSIFVF